MHSIVKSATAALASACIAVASAAAAPLPQEGTLGTAAAPENGVELAQFFSGGREYCFYPDGWHGPGFYWCGYAYRRGFGFGGGPGWHGWRGGPGRGGFHGRPGPGRPGPKGPPPKHH